MSLLLVIATSNVTIASDFKVVFINPGHPDRDSTGTFWSTVNHVMLAAADDLNIELITLFANRDHILMKELANDVAKHRPDFAIIVNEKGAGLELAKTIAGHDIPIFTLLNGFSLAERATLTDKQKSSIIGSLTPDNFNAGKLLAKDLVALHRLKYVNQSSFNLLALQGDYRSAAAIERGKGLSDFLSTQPDIDLIDNPVANWSKDEAYLKVKGLLRRQRIDIIWAANDPMAFGASRAVKEANLPYKVTIGGFNWDEANSLYPIDISYGGHVTLGAKALVMLKDFKANSMQPCEMHQTVNIFEPSSEDRVARFNANISDRSYERFDFKRFSKSHPNRASFVMESFVSRIYKAADNVLDNISCPKIIIN
ncbi:ABC transporter substrate-binding protein [Thalassotalea euphylliae]|uniref:ABC transporter substrate-binding protein n=1 Tax=Thalassotalea euphylliae TaxID=1655234 RepID=UPI0036DB1A67